MTEMRECVACGLVAYAVMPKVVELPEPWDVVDGVPVRFRVELRCVDGIACQERQEAA